MTDYLTELKAIANNFGVYPITHPVLEDGRFPIWSGSAKKGSHHYGDGGLVKHTHEVLDMVLSASSTMELPTQDLKKLVAATIWHDYGKIWDYARVSQHLIVGGVAVKDLGPKNVWQATSHKKEVRHLVRSVIEWEKFAANTKEIYQTDVAWITAVMMSHHGDFDGTTHPPLNAAAWILSCCDKLSARTTEALAGNNMFK